MLARSGTAMFCSFVVLGAALVGAVPTQHAARQVGDLQCNIDRVKIVGSVIQVGQTTRNLTQQLASDPAGSALVATVNKALIEVEDGIADIVSALFSNQKAPASAISQVGDGLTLAFSAAKNITSAETAVKDNVTKLKNELQTASTAGDDVIQNCH